MTNAKLQIKVTEAVKLDREIADKTERLKELKAELVKAADSDLMDKSVTDGGGWSVELQGADGCIARVTQPAAKLKASVDGLSPTWSKLLAFVDIFQLFNQENKYPLKPNFRALLAANYGVSDARKILKLVTSSSSPSVSFETKEAA